MPPKKNNFICREHSGVEKRLDRLEVDVKDHEKRLDDGQRKFADFSGDMRVLKILIILAVIAGWLGSVMGPKVWALVGF